jgi:hypothetical protein
MKRMVQLAFVGNFDTHRFVNGHHGTIQEICIIKAHRNFIGELLNKKRGLNDQISSIQYIHKQFDFRYFSKLLDGFASDRLGCTVRR